MLFGCDHGDHQLSGMPCVFHCHDLPVVRGADVLLDIAIEVQRGVRSGQVSVAAVASSMQRGLASDPHSQLVFWDRQPCAPELQCAALQDDLSDASTSVSPRACVGVMG
jgi:hypothetical protein